MADPVVPVQTFKVELFFHQEQYGWSEVYWVRSNQGIDKVVPLVEELVTVRIPLLAENCYLDEYMVSLQGLFRDSRQSGTNPVNKLPGKKMVADVPFVALLVRMQNGTRYRRNIYLRGLPQELKIPFDVAEGDTAKWAGAYFAFSGFFLGKGANFSIQAVSKEPGEQGQDVVDFVQGAGAFVGYTAIKPTIAGINVGDSVRLRHCVKATKRHIPRSGLYKVVAKDADTVTLGTPWLGDNSYISGATAAKEVGPVYLGRLNLVVLRKVRRKAGVIHLQEKGRRVRKP